MRRSVERLWVMVHTSDTIQTSVEQLDVFFFFLHMYNTILELILFTPPYVSFSPMFYSTSKQCGQTFATENCFTEYRLPLKIGNDVWIQQGVFLCGGIEIGDGAVILAGAVVTKSVPPYAIVGGVPARIVRYRFDEETIKFLQETKWWNNNIDWFRKNWRLMCNISDLKEYLSAKSIGV